MKHNVLRSACIVAITSIAAACAQHASEPAGTAPRASAQPRMEDGLPVVVISARRERSLASNFGAGRTEPPADPVGKAEQGRPGRTFMR